MIEPMMSIEQEKWMVYQILQLLCPDEVVPYVYHVLHEMEYQPADVSVQNTVTIYERGTKIACLKRFSGAFIPREWRRYGVRPLIVFKRNLMEQGTEDFRRFVRKTYSHPDYLEWLYEVEPTFVDFIKLMFHEIGHLSDYYLYGSEEFRRKCYRDMDLPHESRELEIRAKEFADRMTERFLSRAFEYRDWWCPEPREPRRISPEETPWEFTLY